MALTRNFRDTVRARAEREPAFRRALFQEAVQALLQGEADEGRAALRAYINATVGFDRLGEVLGRSPKSLMRMFGPDGNTYRSFVSSTRAPRGEHVAKRPQSQKRR